MVLLFLLKIKIACIIKCLWHRLKIMQNRRKGNMGAEIKKVAVQGMSEILQHFLDFFLR